VTGGNPGTSGTSGISGDGGTAGSGPTCDPTMSPSAETCLVSDDYAIFVAPTGEDTAAGTKKSPVQTIAQGIVLAGGRKIVIACDGTFDERVKLTTGVKLYGGFACPGASKPWAYENGKRAKVAPTTRGYALELSTVTESVAIEDFEFDAQDGSQPGESSVSVFVNASTDVTLTRVTLVAGKGADGANGTGVMTAAGAGATGSKGTAACAVSGADNLGGAAVESTCGGALSGSKGGRGGDGGKGDSSAGNADDGKPNLGAGLGGIGESGVAWGCATGGGQAGNNGLSQPTALGATGPGKLTSSGFTPASGDDGVPGTPGQGGGGGGGAKAPSTACTNGNPRTGASGGSGGGGGCGGKGGTGGGGGGASIALASVNSSIALDTVDMSTSFGGKGGNGGVGQPGGPGGTPGAGASGVGTGVIDSCGGGAGGKGGGGGNAGGGTGGASLGIAYLGTAPTQTAVTIQIAATAALGGADGAALTTGPGAGATGVLAATKSF
jgi:hypothetical protein